jgi:branched-chain amino acid transport system substrate-binding protein
MKRLIYLCSAVILITSFGFAGRTYAAHQASHPAAAVQSLKICSSMPIGVPALKDLSQGIFNGGNLAIAQWKPAFAKIHVKLGNLVEFDYAKSDGSGYSTDQERVNALKCTGMKDTYGYLATLNSAAAAVSEPITNREGMAQISPANTNPTLTDPAQRQSQEPLTASGKLKYVSYYRVVTTDNIQGPADAALINKTLHASKFFLVDDKTLYGAGLAQSMSNWATSKLGMNQVGIGHILSTDAASEAQSGDAVADEIVSKNPDAVFCGCDSETTPPFVRSLRNKGYTKPLIAGDAIANNQKWITDSGKASEDAFGSNVGPDVFHSGKSFRTAYQKKFHVTLDAYDATAYDAANVLLKALFASAKAGKLFKGSMFQRRSSVLPYMAKTKYKGATGLTTFDKNGDTKNLVITYYQVTSGKWVYKGIAPQPKGAKPTGGS